MEIGLFFGSFNPIHNGHIEIARKFVQSAYFDQVWLIVSPQNPFKSTEELADEHCRYEMATLALQNIAAVAVSDVEFGLPKPSYTIDTLQHLSNHYDHKFSLIIGSDNLDSFKQWKEFQTIISDYKIYVYQRPEFPVPKKYLNHPNIIITDFPFIDISATEIRNQIRTAGYPQKFIPEEVLKYIKAHNLYETK